MSTVPDPPQLAGSPARRRFAQSIEDYLAGKIDNFELDAVFLESSAARDEVCDRIGHAVWCSCYSDTRRHRYEGPNRFSLDAEAMVRRWIAILRSDTRWEWERARPWEWVRDIGVLLRMVKRHEPNNSWPFRNEAAWKEWRVRHSR